MKNDTLILWGEEYRDFVRGVVLPDAYIGIRGISYWRDELFCNLITYLVPLSLIALLPSVYMSFQNGIPMVAVADLLGFFSLVFTMLHRGLPVRVRKLVFICVGYTISVALMYYLSVTGAGMLFMLTLSVLTGIIYSDSAAYYTVLANAVICFAFGVLIDLEYIHIASVNRVGTWAAISSNVVFLSLVCVQSLKVLLNGLKKTMNDKLAVEKEKELLTNRLVLATQSAGMGIWEWDIAMDQLFLDDGMLQLYDLNALQSNTVYDGWLSRLHPDDKDRTNSEIQNAIIGIKEYDTEFRIVWRDRSVRYIRATGIIERDREGRAVRMIGANWDITTRRTEQKKLSISEANLKAIIENTETNIYSLDKEYKYVIFNEVLKKSVKQRFNVDIKQGDFVFDFLEKSNPEEARQWRGIYTEALRGKSLKFEKEFNIGQYLYTTSFSINPIIENNEVIGLSCFGIDITDLKKAQKEIQILNGGLEIKIAERTAELEIANKELEAFSYSVSHDLKAPVRTVISFVKMIKKEHIHTLNEDAKELFGYIENSSKRMSKIIDDLLILAKYGKEKLVFSEVDLFSLFNDVWDHLLFTSPHQAKLELDEMPVVYADRSMLQQVVVNMLSNAIKYSSKKERPIIKVGYSKTSESFTIYVKDNGAGFDMKYYDRLFGAFQRLHGETEFEGTGVGLMLTKKIIDRHGGTVWADGKLGEGATFYFSLPTAA
jgi:signal transduction histidine kinase